MTEDKGDTSSSVIVVLILVILALGAGIGIYVCEEHYREEAVKRGYASWKIIDQKGNVKWDWNDKEPKK